MRLHRFVCIASLLLLQTANAQADNWPQWRGVQGDGISKEKNIPTKWSKTEKVAWRTPMPGQAGATPCVWGDRIYTTSAEGTDLVVLCLNTVDGKILWKQKVGEGNQDARSGEGNSASPSPSTDGEHVWVFFGTGALACYSKDGKEVWKFNVSDRFGNLDIQFGMTSTPVLDGDGLYLQLIHGRMKQGDQSRTGKVVKLEKSTGKTVWEVDRVTDAQFECKHSYASPFIYDDKKSKVLVVHGADCTTGHDLATGKELWRFGTLNGPTALNPKPNDITFRFVASPCVDPKSNTIIIPTAKEGPVIAVKVSELQGDSSAKTSAVVWNLPRTPDVSIPLVIDGLVYMLNKDGKLQCVELATGKEVYTNRTYTGQHRTSPLYADGHLYFGSNDGHFTVVKAGKDFEIASTMEMGEAITASAIVSNGTLYIRSYEALYAIRN
ncbi:MAG: PQQ-binding-like beta-propeller repeat protein [Planctomycetota bacterium]|nr:PQQ-binding-like beta-propeller repeat protein [Planctomycetota bacterium]